MTVEMVVADALAQADRLFEDAIRQSMTRLLTFGGPDADADLDAIDNEFARCRDALALERATVPDAVRRALSRAAAQAP